MFKTLDDQRIRAEPAVYHNDFADEVRSLYPAPPGAPPSEAPQPGPRLYHPPTKIDFQNLKVKVEKEWVPEMSEILDIPVDCLPVLWDCDFLLGPRKSTGEDTYVLCEINASSIAPYPESAPSYIARAVKARLIDFGNRL